MNERSTPSKSISQPVFLHIYPSIVRALAACHVNLTELLEKTPVIDLAEAPIDNLTVPEDLWLSLANEVTLSVMNNGRNKHFPVEFAKTFAFDFLSDFSLFVLSCHSLKEAVVLLDWLPPFVCPSVRFDVIDRSDTVAIRVVYQDPYGDADATWAMTETIVATMYQFWKPIVFHDGVDGTPVRACLRHRAHQCSDDLRRFMGCEITYGEAVNELEISKEIYQAPIKTANGTLKDIAQQKITTHMLPRIFKSSSKSPLYQRVNLSRETLETPVVKDLLRMYEAEPRLLGLGLEGCSQKLGMSARTLQRRLAQSHTSHRKIHFEVRRSMAKQLLSNDCLSEQQVSVMLGFNATADFRAFFKQAEGFTPRMWRSRRKA